MVALSIQLKVTLYEVEAVRLLKAEVYSPEVKFRLPLPALALKLYVQLAIPEVASVALTLSVAAVAVMPVMLTLFTTGRVASATMVNEVWLELLALSITVMLL